MPSSSLRRTPRCVSRSSATSTTSSGWAGCRAQGRKRSLLSRAPTRQPKRSSRQMPTITGVMERRGKARVFVDGEFWAEISADVAAERGLQEGAALGLEELDEARIAGERALAMSRALTLLGYRARSEKEVRDRLRRYGYGEDTVECVIGRLKELGYLDDADFARSVAREKARRYGPRRISRSEEHTSELQPCQ